ncbi:MAG: sensor histidine kinase [Acidimicrobiales bacterium]
MRSRPGTEVRLAIAALGALVAAIAALGAWQVIAARDSQLAEIEGSELSAAHLASSALGSALASRLQLLTNLTAQPSLAKVFTSGTAAQREEVAFTLHVVYPGFASFGLVDTKGDLVGTWPRDPAALGRAEPPKAFFTQVINSGKPRISQMTRQLSAPRTVQTVLAAPLRDSTGHTVGVLAASIPGASLGPLIGGTVLPDGAALVIVDHLGRVLDGGEMGSSASQRTPPAISRALSGKAGSTTSRVPGYPGERLVGFAPVASTGWAVLVERPSSALGSQVASLTERLGAIGLLVVVLAIGTVFLVASLLRRLTRERERAGALMASVGEGVATIGADGVVRLANPALERLTGRAGSELVGKSWSDAINLYDHRGHGVTWEGSMVAQAIRERQVLATSGFGAHVGRADGKRVPVAMTASPLWAGDELLGAVVVLRDVSVEREVDQLKSSLVSTVSHELRTPLTMVQGFAELLLSRDDLGAERSREAVSQIHASAQRLGRLIDDLLSVSRIDSGKLRVDLAAVDVLEAAKEVVGVVRSHGAGPVVEPGAQGPGRLLVEVEPGLPPVMADRDKFVQVLTNLVSNALKYSGAPSPVRVVAERKCDHAEISVIDEGIGMTELECSQAFDKFARADRPEVRRVNGTGLGLYITKSLVEMQHGQVWVTSQPGSGSVFTFSLPLAPTTEPDGEPDPGMPPALPALKVTEEAH